MVLSSHCEKRGHKGLNAARCRRLHPGSRKLRPHMAPAKSKRDDAAFGKVRVRHAAEVREMLGRPRMFAVGGMNIRNTWRSAASPGPLVARIGPQLAIFDAPASWIEHRCRRLVGEQLGRLLQLLQEPRMHRPQCESGTAHQSARIGEIF